MKLSIKASVAWLKSSLAWITVLLSLMMAKSGLGEMQRVVKLGAFSSLATRNINHAKLSKLAPKKQSMSGAVVTPRFIRTIRAFCMLGASTTMGSWASGTARMYAHLQEYFGFMMKMKL